MKNQTKLLGLGAMLMSLAACSSSEEPVALEEAANPAAEVVIPSQDDADAAAADAIDETNADAAMADLESEINGDM